MGQQIEDLNLLYKYKNGNYNVELYEDGTKVRYTDEDYFIADRPESIDLKITNACNMGCKFCHEDSVPEGLHGDIDLPFLNDMPRGLEVAVGGGNVFEHPRLVEFLEKMKNQGVICNITIHQQHFMEDEGLLDYLVENDLVKGIGVSYVGYSDSLIEKLNKYPNTCLHVINGIISMNQLRKLYNKKLKILILGYKVLRRGEDYYSEYVENRKKELYVNLREVLSGFKVVSFDNLGIDQLNIKRFMLKDKFNEMFQGEDGTHTFFLDIIEKKFCKSSTSTNRYEMMDNINDMFKVILSESKGD